MGSGAWQGSPGHFKLLDQRLCPRPDAGGLANGEDVSQDPSAIETTQRQHLGGACGVDRHKGQALRHGVLGHGTHSTHALGDDEIRLKGQQTLAIHGVEWPLRKARLRNGRVDLLHRQSVLQNAGGQMRERLDAEREIALMAHTDETIPQPERTEQLGRRRQEADDALGNHCVNHLFTWRAPLALEERTSGNIKGNAAAMELASSGSSRSHHTRYWPGR